ncbi:MAG: hypothetical protein LQ346_006253 [Caloplaca aetnensis]|nr:MAG: hypothetical protein LQ346_006253 [Caloplaca aetnensis]
MANDALVTNGHPSPGHGVNGATSAIGITTHGSNWYWAVTAVMAVTTFVFIGLSFTKPRSHRIFHYITAAITMVAAIAYFTMASDLGQTPIPVEFPRGGRFVDSNVANENREIFYVRYIDWTITTPLLLLDLLLTAGLPWPTILYTILIDEIMIVTGLVGALVQSSYKWGYFAFGCAAFLWVAFTVVVSARRYASVLGSDISRTYTICGAWTIFLWFLYPIAWGLCEGGNVISPDSEGIFYGVLDLMAKPVFGALLLWGHRNIEPSRLGLHVRDYDEHPSHVGEKNIAGHHGEHGGLNDGVASNGATATTATPGTTTV